MDDVEFTPSGVLRLCKGPWLALGVGGAATLSACLIQLVSGASIIPLAIAGVVAAGVGVAIRPRDPTVLITAAICGVASAFGLPADWDSIRFLLFVLSVLAAVCTILVVLPRTLRRLAFSVLIVGHFAAIGTAAFNVAPAPWLIPYLWARFSHYYLDLVYLNNAYHFYAPEPGPGQLVWFYIKYDDGSTEWFKIPERESHAWLLNYQRRLSVAEGINSAPTIQSIPENVLAARLNAGQRDGIPFYEGLRWSLREYNPPPPYIKRNLRDYARHVATVKNAEVPGRHVVGIKIYRVTHRLLLPKEILAGVEPTKIWTYQPYFFGEYDPEGNLKDPNDPYLYWLLPITNRKNPQLSIGGAVEADDKSAAHQDDDIINTLDIHIKLPSVPDQGPGVPGER